MPARLLNAATLPESATLPDAVRRAAALWPDRVAWVFDPGETLTFRDVADRTEGIAAHLHACGVRAGDRVAVMLPNRAEFPLVWLALARLGAAMVPLNLRYRAEDAGYILAKSRAVLLVSDADSASHLTTDLPRLDVADLPDVAGEMVPADIASTDIANVQFTSGTTGHPKGCLLSQGYWLHLATSLQSGFPYLAEADTMLTAQPMSYMDPMWNVAAALVSGARLVVLDGFHPTSFWAKVREHRVTYFYCLAAMPTLMLTTPVDPADRDHRVRVVQCSAIPPGRHAEIEVRWGVKWYEVFGMTETGGDIHVTDEDHDELVGSGSIGRVKEGREARIVAADGLPVAHGDIGELVLRGVGMMDGYDGDPEATARVFRDGWLHTGDLARMDETGHVWLVGRVKDVVRRAGENVAAREVEDSLVSDPRVRLVAVTGVPDEIRGEEVKAYLVVTEPWDAREAAEHLRPALAQRLASFKVPRYWEVRDDLPRTPSERVAKKELIPGRTWDAVDGQWV